MNASMPAKPVSTETTKEAERYYLMGMKLLKDRKIKKALQTLNKAVKLNPSHAEAQSALNNAKEALRWNRVHICKNCGGLIKPSKDYPEIAFEGFCSQCGQKMSERAPIVMEVSLGFTELFAKAILFASLPLAIFVFSMLPMRQATPRGIYNVWSTLLEAAVLSLHYTPFFLILFLSYSPSWQFAVQAGNSIEELRASVHPLLFFPLEIAVFFLIVYFWAFMFFTPFLYIHRKDLWRDWERQKYLLLFALLFTVMVVLRRISAGVFY